LTGKLLRDRIVSKETIRGGYRIGKHRAVLRRHLQAQPEHNGRQAEGNGARQRAVRFFSRHSQKRGHKPEGPRRRLFVEKSTTAKAVKYLIAKGYVYKKQVASDKRYSSLYLTEKGRASAEAVKDVFSEMLGVYSEDIPDEEIGSAIAVLKKVIINLQNKKSEYAGEEQNEYKGADEMESTKAKKASRWP
jgi:DNA-binding MarR family transcriptional regulator